MSEFRQLTLELPFGVAPEDVAAGAFATLELRDRVHTVSQGGTTLATSTLGNVLLGNDTRVESVVSGGNASLGDRAFVSGSVLAAGTIQKGHAVTVQGEEVEGHVTIPHSEFSWDVILPPPLAGDRHLEPDTSARLDPNSYEALTVKSRATAYLRTGTYVFSSMSLEPQAELIIDDRSGPVVIYVRDHLAHKGVILGSQPAPPQLLVVYLGTDISFIEASFVGTIVAPDATVRLQAATPDGHTGAFFAKHLVAEPATIIHHRAFPWFAVSQSDAEGEPLPTLTPAGFPPSPIHVLSNGPDGGSTELNGPVEFELPDRIRVSSGNAGMGELTLTFQPPGGGEVVCSYTGGADVPHPDTLLEFAKGLYYHFDSCSNGLAPGDSATAIAVTVSQTGDPDSQTGEVSVELALGGGCSGPLEPPISALESRQMVESFDWAAVSPLEEIDPETGLPALYYATIYVRTEQEHELLDTFRIHHQTKPLFAEEYAKYQGKCGTIRYEGDGEGTFLFAVISGAMYNRLLSATTHPDIPPEDREVFRAVVLRAAPPDALTSIGSLRYDALIDYGFQYRNQTQEPHSELPDELVQGMGSGNPVKHVIDVVAYVWERSNEVADLIQEGIGFIDRFVHGTVRMRIDLSVLNRDPFFSPWIALQRGWGPAAGRELAPTVPVQIYALSSATLTGGTPIPTLFEGHTNSEGRTSIPVAKDGDFHNTLPWSLCIEMKNQAAKLTGSIVIDELCNFDAPSLNSMFNSFESDADVPLNTRDFNLHALAQMQDVHDYTFFVAGTYVRQALVLTGHLAAALGTDSFGLGERRLWTPCQRFPTRNTELLAWVALNFAEPIIAVVDRTDIVMPSFSNARRSRGIMSHEYGHFVFCHFMNELELLDTMSIDTFLEQIDPEEGIPVTSETRILNEAFAEFIMGQVSGGANYWVPTNSIVDEGAESDYDRFCYDGDFSDPISLGPGCMEQNVTEFTTGNLGIALISTLLHDAFDGWPKGSLNPTNGDLFDLVAPRPPPPDLPDFSLLPPNCAFQAAFAPELEEHCLEYTNATYAESVDEPVQMPGTGIPLLFGRYKLFEPDELAIEPFMQALASAMYQTNHTWCEVCMPFALHDVPTFVDASPAVCTGDSLHCGGNRCIDRRDHENCLACGFACNELQRCSPTGCTFDSCDPFTDCDGSCVDVLTNERHCGQCGRVCTRGQVCDQGQCTGAPEYTMQLWQHCQAALTNIVGPPPDPTLRLNRNTCTSCPEGSISNMLGECEACPPNTTVVGNVCAFCNPDDSIPHAGQCCAFDANTDIATLDPALDLGCDVPSLPGGDCEIRSIHVTNLDTYTQGGRTGAVTFMLLPTSAASCVGQTFEIQIHQRLGGVWTAVATLQVTGQAGPPGVPCVFDPPLEFPITSAEINAGVTEIAATGRSLDQPAPPFAFRMSPDFDPPWFCGGQTG